VSGLVDRFSSLYGEYDSYFLEIVSEAGTVDFLKLIEEEYRPGEAELGRAYLHICRVNGIEPPLLREIERVVKRADAMVEEQRRILSGDIGNWPATVQLELACKECGKKYSYDIHEVHLHPHEKPAGESEADMTPYKQGLVIADDVRCKNCGALNRMELTGKTMAQLTAESVKILAFQRAGVEVPSAYPVKHVQLGERDGKPLTLADAEMEHINAAELAPGKPGVQLALGKFYEYVKEFSTSKQEYLRALDSDSKALEAMAGLARLAHAEGDLKKANEWIEDCYENLESGKLYLAKDVSEFKKAVREKRREYARESGLKPEDKPVKIRFSMDVPDFPKNRPCPCGSGKKYKLCCMKAQQKASE
jgi:tetratricopeptide (TPR) repeat protein